jgi:stage V sporulation protein AE
MGKNKIIAVTDGDATATRAVEEASNNLDLEVIYESAGNPTPSTGFELLIRIKESSSTPVIVMFDDQGEKGTGLGEKALATVLSDSEIEVLGVLAVASNLKDVQGIKPDFSINQNQELTDKPVDKAGQEEAEGHSILEGDTIDILNSFSDRLIIGIGDLGKMEEKDLAERGAPITTRAISEILERSE